MQAVIEETVKLAVLLGLLLGGAMWLGGEYWLRLFTQVQLQTDLKNPSVKLAVLLAVSVLGFLQDGTMWLGTEYWLRFFTQVQLYSSPK